MIEGKTVNLRIVDREDLPLLIDWNSSSEFYGEYSPLRQLSKTEWEKRYDNLTADTRWFFVEKKDGTKIGEIGHNMLRKLLEIYCYLVQSERGKGYGTEAIMIMVDYLFLSRELMGIQATTDVSNIASQRVRAGTASYFRKSSNFQ